MLTNCRNSNELANEGCTTAGLRRTLQPGPQLVGMPHPGQSCGVNVFAFAQDREPAVLFEHGERDVPRDCALTRYAARSRERCRPSGVCASQCGRFAPPPSPRPLCATHGCAPAPFVGFVPRWPPSRTGRLGRAAHPTTWAPDPHVQRTAAHRRVRAHVVLRHLAEFGESRPWAAANGSKSTRPIAAFLCTLLLTSTPEQAVSVRSISGPRPDQDRARLGSRQTPGYSNSRACDR